VTKVTKVTKVMTTLESLDALILGDQPNKHNKLNKPVSVVGARGFIRLRRIWTSQRLASAPEAHKPSLGIALSAFGGLWP